MDEIWPVTIIKSRYSGTYSKSKWLALHCTQSNIPDEVHGSDVPCMEYFSDIKFVEELGYVDKNTNTPFGDDNLKIGCGGNPKQAFDNLKELVNND